MNTHLWKAEGDKYAFLWKRENLDQGFSASPLLTFWVGQFFVVGSCPVYCRMVSLYSVDANSRPFIHLWPLQRSSDIAQCPRGETKLPSVKNHSSRYKVLKSQITDYDFLLIPFHHIIEDKSQHLFLPGGSSHWDCFFIRSLYTETFGLCSLLLPLLLLFFLLLLPGTEPRPKQEFNNS